MIPKDFNNLKHNIIKSTSVSDKKNEIPFYKKLDNKITLKEPISII